MLLLVVFFVMLIAYSAVDKDRFLKIQNVTRMMPVLLRPSPDINQAMQSLRQLSTTESMNGILSVVPTQDGFKAVVPNRVLFASGEALLSKDVYPLLDGIINIALRDRLSIQVDGHTDNIPIHTDKFPSNWELSTIRAVSILRYFEQNGMPAARLAAVGFAEYQPATGNDTPEGRQKNRRIEVYFRPFK
jgi:chemotaxis protein MotB